MPAKRAPSSGVSRNPKRKMEGIASMDRSQRVGTPKGKAQPDLPGVRTTNQAKNRAAVARQQSKGTGGRKR